MLADLPADHDLDHLELALEYCASFRTAVDAGANVGIWTSVLAKRFQRVWAFEPVSEYYDRIPLAVNVKKVRAAVGDQMGWCSIEPGETNIGEGHVVPGNETPMIYLDAIDLRAVDFIKFDVEGYELFAVNGAARTIKLHKPVICIEEKHHGQQYYGLEPNAATHLLEAMGYHVVARIGRDVILTT